MHRLRAADDGGAVPAYRLAMRRLAPLTLLVLTIAALAGPSGAAVAADYVSVGGAALRLKKTGAGGFVPEYTHFDSQGSAVAATNAAGSVTWRERYAPFGEELLNPAANANNTAYTGHLKDDSTGLNYMQARYYDPILGRFLSTDPIGYQDQLNLYAYVANDPVNKVDPTGEYAESAFDIAFIIADVIDIKDNGLTLTNGLALAADLVGLALPGATGGGAAIRGGANLIDAVRGGDKVQTSTAAGRNTTCCFVAGTLVETQDGLKAIEDIKVGDLVHARDVETGETTLKPVTDLIRRHERVIWEVVLAGPNGETARFETTDDHPWWIAGQGWKTTQELAAGMAVVTKDGRGMVVAAVTETDRSDSTYNLTIADFETYFVGEERVLVHNCPTGSGRGSNNLKPDSRAEGAHSTFRRDANGNVTHTATYEPNAKNPSGFDEVSRTDVTGAAHFNKATGEYVPTPHVQGKDIPGGVRAAEPREIPRPCVKDGGGC